MNPMTKKRRTEKVSASVKILFVHPFQGGSDQVAIGFKQTRGNTRLLGLNSFCAVLEYSRILHRVFPSYSVRNTLAVQHRFSVESEHRGAELRIEPACISIGHNPRDRRRRHHRHDHHGRRDRHRRRLRNRENQNRAFPSAALR